MISLRERRLEPGKPAVGLQAGFSHDVGYVLDRVDQAGVS